MYVNEIMNEITWVPLVKHDWFKSNCYGREASFPFSFSCIVLLSRKNFAFILCLLVFQTNSEESCTYKRNINVESNTLLKESRIMSHHNIIIFSYRNLLDMWRLWHQRYCPHRQEYWMNSWLSTQYILFLL